MRDAGCGMPDAGCGVRDVGCGVRDVGCGVRDVGCGVRVMPLKERFALRALRLRSVPSELETYLPQAQRSSSETLIKRSAP